RLGRVSQTSVPYYATMTAAGVVTPTADSALLWITKKYDGLGRVTTLIHADGARATSSYDRWSTTTIDEPGRRTTDTTDADGHPRHHEENRNGARGVSTYLYEVRGNLVGMVDPAGNAWHYAIDSLGRKTNSWDPDLGHTSYRYDATGRMTSLTDAKGQTT